MLRLRCRSCLTGRGSVFQDWFLSPESRTCVQICAQTRFFFDVWNDVRDDDFGSRFEGRASSWSQSSISLVVPDDSSAPRSSFYKFVKIMNSAFFFTRNSVSFLRKFLFSKLFVCFFRFSSQQLAVGVGISVGFRHAVRWFYSPDRLVLHLVHFFFMTIKSKKKK